MLFFVQMVKHASALTESQSGRHFVWHRIARFHGVVASTLPLLWVAGHTAEAELSVHRESQSQEAMGEVPAELSPSVSNVECLPVECGQSRVWGHPENGY